LKFCTRSAKFQSSIKAKSGLPEGRGKCARGKMGGKITARAGGNGRKLIGYFATGFFRLYKLQ